METVFTIAFISFLIIMIKVVVVTGIKEDMDDNILDRVWKTFKRRICRRKKGKC